MAPFGKATFREEGRVANVKRHIRSVFELAVYVICKAQPLSTGPYNYSGNVSAFRECGAHTSALKSRLC